jgi:hypothetical protein
MNNTTSFPSLNSFIITKIELAKCMLKFVNEFKLVIGFRRILRVFGSTRFELQTFFELCQDGLTDFCIVCIH